MVAITEQFTDLDEQMIYELAQDPAKASDLEQMFLSEPVNWIEAHCLITDKQGKQIPLELNEAQVIVQQVKNELRRQGKPIRIIVLKARQLGITTEASADSYCDINTKCNRRAMIVAHKQESSVDIFRRVRQMQDSNPYRRKEKYNNRREIEFDAPHNSLIAVQTAGNPELGRGSTNHYVHCSEVAFWPFAKESLNAVMQSIPDASVTADTCVVLESTANGLGGTFYDIWCGAKPYDPDNKFISLCKGETEWVGIFLPWHIFEQYKSPVPADFERTTCDHPVYGNETDLTRIYNLCDEQLQWRRETIRSKCLNDPELFQQEYPSCDVEAFLVSGRPVFNVSILREMLSQAKKPVLQGEFADETIDTETQVRNPSLKPDIKFIEDKDNPYPKVRIWQKPITGIEYVIGGDTAEGLDPSETKDCDSNSATVLRADTRQMVAKLEGQFDSDIYGTQLDCLGRYYNNALVGIEINNTSGGATRSRLRHLNYPNLYTREKYSSHSDEPTKEIGWRTDAATRGMMVTTGQSWVRNRLIFISCWKTIGQMSAWRYDKTGKPIHPDGEHDDDVISLLIAIQMLVYLADNRAANIARQTTQQESFSGDMVVGGCEGPVKIADDTDNYYY